MGNGIHISQKSKVRRHKKKTRQEELAVKSARYIQGYSVAITFTNGKTKLIDFLPLFLKYVKGDNTKYFTPASFKRFVVKNGNIYWGKNEDVVFPSELLFKNQNEKNNKSDKIIYVL